MDWPRDNAELSDYDINRVFQYMPQESVVVRQLTTDIAPVVWSNSSTNNWKSWLEQKFKSKLVREERELEDAICLQIWTKQLAKMLSHLEELFDPRLGYSLEVLGVDSKLDCKLEQFQHSDKDVLLERTNIVIKDRLQLLIEELKGKIEDCTNSIDGMAIAIQWSQADVNVDIAKAAGRDSSQMRSIALVTMVFLPGTFFATLFSMTFFNWNRANDGTATVSRYIWVYFLVTSVFTLGTLFMWWYFLVYRRTRLLGTHSFNLRKINWMCC